MWKSFLIVALLALACACRSTSLEPRVVVTLTGQALPALLFEDERRAELELSLAEARAELDRRPNSEDAHIWVGRRLAYLGRYGEAIDAFSLGLERFPDSYRLLRHRGHRYITTRRLHRAVADLELAAERIRAVPDEIEKDGAPNALGIPRSTNHSNVMYHLGLAQYLLGEFDEAYLSYRRCLDYVTNDDMLVATSHWLYMTLRRLGRDDDAAEVLNPIQPEMDVIENHGYHRLLLFYQGKLTAEEVEPLKGDGTQTATVGYGLANWELYNGRTIGGHSKMDTIIRTGAWPAFGFIAAEAEIARHGLRP